MPPMKENIPKKLRQPTVGYLCLDFVHHNDYSKLKRRVTEAMETF